MRAPRSLECNLVAFVLLAAPVGAQPQETSVSDEAAATPAPTTPAPTTPAPPEESAEVLAARRHFANGVRLYQDANYSAALIEFRAANELKPGAPSLQNIALCQKALFRYAAAAATLDLLLANHGSALPPAERDAVEAAKQELASLTRHVR